MDASADSAAAQSVAGAGLARRLREGTAELHALAERSGIARDILRGTATPVGYALFLRNLLPVYRAMEHALEARRDAPLIAPFALPSLYRAAALESDLALLCGDRWRESLAWLPAAQRYAQRVDACAQGDGARLIAHAYVRYLGDLSGGQVLRRLLARSLRIGSEALRFYEFPGIRDADRFKAEYRRALDCSALSASDADAVVEEAAAAFQLNIELSEAVQEVARSIVSSAPREGGSALP
jgi:heme oxygenase